MTARRPNHHFAFVSSMEKLFGLRGSPNILKISFFGIHPLGLLSILGIHLFRRWLFLGFLRGNVGLLFKGFS